MCLVFCRTVCSTVVSSSPFSTLISRSVCMPIPGWANLHMDLGTYRKRKRCECMCILKDDKLDKSCTFVLVESNNVCLVTSTDTCLGRKYGASVSSRILSSGIFLTASRTSTARWYVTSPVKPTHRLGNSLKNGSITE